MKRLLTLSIVCILLFTMVCPVLAVTPRYNYTHSIYANIDINTTWGLATCTGEVIADDNYPVELVLYLQVYKNGTWQTVKSWSTTDIFTAYISKPYAIYKGYEYRAYAVAYIYNDNNAVIEIVDVYDTQWYGDYINEMYRPHPPLPRIIPSRWAHRRGTALPVCGLVP